MPFPKKPVGALLSVLALASTTFADSYHAVEPGETLQSVAERFRMTATALRAANNLTNLRDSSALPSMLLLIPDSETKLPALTNSGPALRSSASTVNAPSGNSHSIDRSVPRATSGGMMQMTSYVVQKGETLDSIARKFSQNGLVVTAADIRRRNYISGEPAAGTLVLVPAGVPASSVPVAAPPVVREENNIATVIEQPTPVYQSPTATFTALSAARRGTVLTSRGLPDDGVRVVQPGQETSGVTAPPSPRSRVMTFTQDSAGALASVAKVARSGGTIRRLPESDAVALYRCGVGTELAVTKRNGDWSAVLMSDRSTGWIPSKYLDMTGVRVDISTQVVAQDTYQGTTQGNFSSNNRAVSTALGWLGTRYVYGGSTRRGIDCSALVMKSFAACGTNLPRTAAQQAKVGTPVAPAELKSGDRLYFSASGTRVDHTGLYMGNGMFVHASGRGRQVMVSSLFDRAHWNIFVGARR